MPDIARIIAVIENGTLSRAQLMTQYNNVVGHKGTTEKEKETLIAAIEKQLRVRFPKAATKIFGSRDATARDILSNIDSDILRDFDLSKNKLNNGVKTGKDVFTGKSFVHVNLSYKNSENVGVYFILNQETPTDELVAIVGRYKTGKEDPGEIERHIFGLDEKDRAVDTYRRFLAMVVDL
ncbi:MAG: hypothetical protein IH626_21035 [Rhodospirillales bacterium]|nr:hypothetical protein [Rhodospirillales bacterium]